VESDFTSKLRSKIMEKLSPEKIINVEGPAGKSIFHRFMSWCLPKDVEHKFQHKIDNEIFAPVSALNDDRLLVLVGALVVENTLDELLAAIMPGYKTLRDKRDFTFSMRIEIARALQLIPTRILNCADFIRVLRNDFVHDLSVKGFDDLEQSKIQALHDRLSGFTPKKFDKMAESFRMLVSHTAIALYGYAIHVSRLNDFMRSAKFSESFKTYIETKTGSAA
jgi:hypothetical protein